MPTRGGRSDGNGGHPSAGNGHADTGNGHASAAGTGNGHADTGNGHAGTGRAASRGRSRRRGSRELVAPSHVVVTGAAGAIGAAIAREMRDRWPGVLLSLVDLDAQGLAATAARLATGAGESTASEAKPRGTTPGVSTHAADLRDITGLAKLVDEIERHGPIDGLVNCAGIMRIRSLAGWDWQEAAALLDIDLTAPLYLQQRIVPAMVERGGGVLVNIASMAGRVPLKGGTYYCAAKAGLAMASEIARAELSPHGIRVVTVYPGPVKSALEQGARDDYGGAGLFGRVAPTGHARSLARKIMTALDRDEPRVIYPRVYGMGWTAPNLSSWITLSYGPPPVR